MLFSCDSVQVESSDLPWYALRPESPCAETESTLPDMPDVNDKSTMLPSGPDYTLISKTGKPVKIVKREADAFLREAMRASAQSVDLDGSGSKGKLDSSSDFVVIGRTESTKHVICSMRSSVPVLSFTRLISSKCDPILLDKTIPIKESEQNDVNNVEKKIHVKVKVETLAPQDETTTPQEITAPQEIKMEVGEPEKSTKSSDSSSLKDTCNGHKDGHGVISSLGFSQKSSRLNKTSKLDAILKRINKVTVENSLDTSKVSDAKSRLDLLVGNVDNSTSDKINNEPKVELRKENEIEKETKPIDGVVEDKTKYNDKETESITKVSESSKKKGLVLISQKRTLQEVEEESWSPDEASLSITEEAQDWLAKRVLCTGTVLRNLSFIPGNDEIMGKNPAMMALLGRTILLHHEHPSRSPSTPHYDREDDADIGDWCSSLATDNHWWWPYLHHLHEACLVTLCNLACHLDLSQYPEEITRPVLSGLLHWATCPASYGQDPLPSGGISLQSALSPQRLALEALVKLCVQDQNTDLVLATPPFTRLEQLCSQLTRMLCRGEDQVLREFSINLLHYFSTADTGVARLIALQNGAVSLLVAFIEEAETAAMNVANSQGVNALKENPELMGTSLDMVRRAANTLVHLSKVSENSRILATCENRLLTLVMSQILDTYVASQLSQVLFNMAQVKSEQILSGRASSPLDNDHVAATADVVPPPSPLKPPEGNHETPVLVAALSDFNSKPSLSTTERDVGQEVSSAVVCAATTNGPKDASVFTAQASPASNGTTEEKDIKPEPMEVDFHSNERIAINRDIDESSNDKDSKNNNVNESNDANYKKSGSDLISSDCKPINAFSDNNSITSNHSGTNSYLANEKADSPKYQLENNRQNNLLTVEKLDKKAAPVENDTKVESVNRSSPIDTSALPSKEANSNDTKAEVTGNTNKVTDALRRNSSSPPSTKENSTNLHHAREETLTTNTGIKCDTGKTGSVKTNDTAKTGSVMTNDTAVMPSS